MNSIKSVFCLIFMTLASFNGWTQETEKNNNIKTTFSVEVNANTTMDELEEIEELLKNDYHVTVIFEDVKMENQKIVALRMRLINGNQSFMKSVNNLNMPINSFKITLTETTNGTYIASVDNGLDRSVFGSKSQDMLSGFSDLNSVRDSFFDFDQQMEQMIQQMQKSEERFQSFFKELENDPKSKKQTIEKDGSKITIISSI